MAKGNRSSLDAQQIALAVVESRTKTEAAERLRITPRTLFDKLKSREVQALIASFRADSLQSRLAALEDAQTDALQTVRNILKSDETSAGEKLKAAQIILNTGRAARLDLEEAERAISEQLRAASEVFEFDPLQIVGAMMQDD